MIIQLSNLLTCNCSMASLNSILSNYTPTPLSNIGIMDLCLDPSNPTLPLVSGHGVYLFYVNNMLLYVGSCSSQLFLHRIPSHLDHRNLSSFSQNTFLQKLIISTSYPNITTLIQAQNYSFNNVAIILINFSQNDLNRYNIRKFENVLRQTLNPSLNGGCSFNCYSNIANKSVSAVI